ncbi:MAG: YapH protein, partial [uncultured bacterium]
FNFQSFENLTGGSGTDNFIFSDAKSISGDIDGGSGTNTLNMAAYTTAVSVNLQTATATSVGGTFSNISNFVGGSASDTLTAANTTNTFTINGSNAGTVGSSSFSNFENLTGGTGNDTFTFLSGGSVSYVRGGATGTDTIDWNSLGSALSVVINGAGTNHGLQGTATLGTANFDDITNVVGTIGSSTISSPNAQNTWTVNGTNSGNVASVNGTLTFSSFGNISGSNNGDTFTLTSGALDTLTGGTGSNVLSYTAGTIGSITMNGPTSVTSSSVVTTGNQSYTNISLDNASGLSLQSSGGTVNISGNVNGNTRAFSVTNAASSTISGAIIDITTLTKAGSGTLTLASANTLSGATTINGGTLQINHANGLGTSNTTPITIASGATLDLNFSSAIFGNSSTINANSSNSFIFSGNNITLSNPIVLGTTNTFTTANTTTLNGAISGAFGITKAGTGTLILGGTNSYSGATIVNAGTLRVNSAAALGNTSGTTVSSGGTLNINFSGALTNAAAISLSGTGVGGNGALTLTGAVNTLSNPITLASDTSINGNSGTATLSGVISGAFKLTKLGTGIMTLSGANTFGDGTDGLTVSAGTVRISNSAGLGANKATVNNNATLQLVGTTLSVANPISIIGTGATGLGALLDSNASGANTITGTVTLSGASTIGVGLNSVLTLNSLSGSGLTKSGTGTLVLPNANSLSGATSLTAGTLRVRNNTALGTSSLTVGSGTTLQIAQQATPLNVANTLTVNSGGVILDNNANGNNTLSGTINLNGTVTINVSNTINDMLTLSGTVNGTGVTLTKNGVGTLTISGNNASFTGNTIINSGTLNIAHSNALGTLSTNNITANSGTSLLLTGTSLSLDNNITLNNASITDTNSSSANVLSGDIALTGTNTITVDDTVNPDNNTLALSGTITGSGITLNKLGDSILILSGNNSTLTGNINVNAGTLELGHDNALGTTTLNVNGSAIRASASRTISNNILFDNNSTVGGSNDIIFNGGMTLNSGTLAVTDTGTTTFNGVISGAGSININSTSGTSIFGNTNTYSGTTYLTSGTLQLNNAAGLGTSTLIFNGGTLSTSAAMTITNDFAVNTSSIIGGANDITFAGTGTLNSDLTISGVDTATFTFDDVLSGSGRINLNDADATLILSVANTYSGGTTLTNGTLQIVDGASLGTGTVNLNGGTFIAANTMTVANNFVIGGNAEIDSTSSALTLSGAGTFNSGATLTNSSAAGLTFDILGSLSGNGNIVQNAGTLSINSTNNNAYNGTITVNNGSTLAVENTAATNNALGAGTTVTITDGIFKINNNAVLTLNILNMGSASGSATLLTTTGAELTAPMNLAADSSVIININGIPSTTLIINKNIYGNANLAYVGTGTLVINGEVGKDQNNDPAPLQSINDTGFTGTIIYGGTDNITTGDQTYGASTPIILVADAKFISLNGNVYMAASIDGLHPLTFDTAGISVITGTIGGSTAVSSLNVTADGGILLGADITLNGNTAAFNSPVTLIGNPVVSDSGSINFNSTINSDSAATPRSLTVISDTAVGLHGNIGSTIELNGLTVSGTTTIGSTAVNAESQNYNGSVNLNTSNINLTGDNITFVDVVNGSNAALQVNGSNIVFGDTVSINSLNAIGGTLNVNGGAITTVGSQVYDSTLALGNNTTLNLTGAGSKDVAITNGITGNKDLTISGSGSGSHNITINGNVAVNSLNIDAGAGSSNNTLSVEGGTIPTTWNINGINSGSIDADNISNTVGFNNIDNINGSTTGNTFIFTGNAALTGTVDGRAVNIGNTLDYTSYTGAVDVQLTAEHNGSISGTTFTNVDNLKGNGPDASIKLPNKANNAIVITDGGNGFINDPDNFTNFNTFVSQSGQDQVTFNAPVSAFSFNQATNTQTVVVNGVTMFFVNFGQLFGAPVPPSIVVPPTTIAGTGTAVTAGGFYVPSTTIIQGYASNYYYTYGDPYSIELLGFNNDTTFDITTDGTESSTPSWKNNVNNNMKTIVKDVAAEYKEALDNLIVTPNCSGAFNQ